MHRNKRDGIGYHTDEKQCTKTQSHIYVCFSYCRIQLCNILHCAKCKCNLVFPTQVESNGSRCLGTNEQKKLGLFDHDMQSGCYFFLEGYFSSPSNEINRLSRSIDFYLFCIYFVLFCVFPFGRSLKWQDCTIWSMALLLLPNQTLSLSRSSNEYLPRNGKK